MKTITPIQQFNKLVEDFDRRTQGQHDQLSVGEIINTCEAYADDSQTPLGREDWLRLALRIYSAHRVLA